MALIVDFQVKSQVSALSMFQALTSGDVDSNLCPRGSLSTLPALSPCNGCPLFEVCSDECGMNDANGYVQLTEDVAEDYKGLFFNS